MTTVRGVPCMSELVSLDASDVMMNSPWPRAWCDNSDGHAWALAELGETVTKTCCGTPCTHDYELLAAEDVSSNFWCTRKHLCVHQNWKFKYATRILDVIIFQYTVKVRPMPGMWIQSKPVTAIPWGGLNIGQRGALLSSIREDSLYSPWCKTSLHGVSKN